MYLYISTYVYISFACSGDAAHPLRPTGEGTALALEDAWTLGTILGGKEEADPSSLREYEVTNCLDSKF